MRYLRIDEYNLVIKGRDGQLRIFNRKKLSTKSNFQTERLIHQRIEESIIRMHQK